MRVTLLALVLLLSAQSSSAQSSDLYRCVNSAGRLLMLTSDSPARQTVEKNGGRCTLVSSKRPGAEQVPAPQRKQSLDAANAELKAALDDARLSPIRNKVSLGAPSRATLPMMALTTTVSLDDEKRAIELWQDVRRTMYRDRFRKIHLQYEPWVVPFLDTEAAAEFSLIADLYTGKMTYGAFNSQRIELRNRSVEAVRQRYQELVREREAAIQKQQQELGEQQRAIAEHQRYERFIAEQRRLAEINRQAQLAQQAQAQYNFERAMALARFQAFLQSRQLINQTYGPTRMAPFSCTRFGNTIDCY